MIGGRALLTVQTVGRFPGPEEEGKKVRKVVNLTSLGYGGLKRVVGLGLLSRRAILVRACVTVSSRSLFLCFGLRLGGLEH